MSRSSLIDRWQRSMPRRCSEISLHRTGPAELQGVGSDRMADRHFEDVRNEAAEVAEVREIQIVSRVDAEPELLRAARGGGVEVGHVRLVLRAVGARIWLR